MFNVEHEKIYLHAWTKANELSIKTYLSLLQCCFLIDIQVTVKICCSWLERVISFRNVVNSGKGMFIDYKLNFKDHIPLMCNVISEPIISGWEYISIFCK